jgi:hypothetical protein
MCLNTLVCFLCKEQLTKTANANIIYPLTSLFDTILFSSTDQQRFTCGSLYILLQELSDCVTLFGAFAKFREATTSFVVSVRPSHRLSAWNNSAPTGRIFMKSEYVSRICRGSYVSLNLTRIRGIYMKSCCTFMTYLVQFLLEWGMFQKKNCRHNQTFYIQLPFSDNRVVYESMWGKNGTAGQVTDDSWIRHMRTACCMAMTTDTNLEDVIFISLLRHQWLNEFTSVFR